MFEANEQIHGKPDGNSRHNAKYQCNPAMPHAISFGLIRNPDSQYAPACDGVQGIPCCKRIYEASTKRSDYIGFEHKLWNDNDTERHRECQTNGCNKTAK